MKFKDMSKEERQKDLAKHILREIKRQNPNSGNPEELKKLAENMAIAFTRK